jgi:hypothetical protein
MNDLLKSLLRLFHPKAIAESFTFFGGGGSTNTVQKQYSPEEEAMRKALLGEAQKVYAKTQPQFEAALYPGAKPIGPSTATQASQAAALNTALGPGQQVADTAANAINFGLNDVLQPGANPALQGHIDSAVRRVGEAYTDPGGVISNIRSNFMQSSPSGQSSREAIAMGLAGRSYLNTVGDVTASMTSDAYNKGLDTFRSTLAFSPQAYNLMMQPAATLSAVGGQQEAYAANQEAYQAAARQWGLNAPWQGLQNFANIIHGGANPSTVSTGETASNPMMGAAGGAMAGWAIGAQTGAASGGPYGAVIGAALGLLLS